MWLDVTAVRFEIARTPSANRIGRLTARGRLGDQNAMAVSGPGCFSILDGTFDLLERRIGHAVALG